MTNVCVNRRADPRPSQATRPPTQADSPSRLSAPAQPPPSPAYSVAAIRQDHPNAYERWTAGADDELARRYREGTNAWDLARHFHRGEGAIRSRLEPLGLA